MILHNVIRFYANLSGDMLPKALLSIGLISLGGLAILITWISLLYRLISIAEGKKSPQHFLLGSIVIPYLNLLWIPWALIAGNGYVKKAQLRYIHVDTLNPGMGIQILSIPLLVLYLFWTVLILFFHKDLTANLSSYDIALYLGVIIISMMIVVAFYLVYLVLFLNKLRLAKQAAKNHHLASNHKATTR